MWQALTLVDSTPQALAGVCERVSVDVAKSVLKQGAVQHLYGKLSAQVRVEGVPGMLVPGWKEGCGVDTLAAAPCV